MIERLVILRKNNVYFPNNIKRMIFTVGTNFAFFEMVYNV